jgi:very-short-patch-repair endonuclease
VTAGSPWGGVLTVPAARTLGITPAQLRGPRFRRLARGAFVPAGTPDSFAVMAEAALALAPAGASLFGVSALRAWGVAVPSRLERQRRIHLAVPPRATISERSFIVAHRSAVEVERLGRAGGLRAATPAWAWSQAAGTASVGELVQLGDGLLRYRDALSDLGAMSRAVAAFAGRRGARRLREAFELVRPGTDSIAETQIRLIVRQAGLPEPKVNVVVYTAAGEWVARVDMLIEEYRLVIEHDGRVHEDNRQRIKDNTRRRALRAEGYTVIVSTAPDLRDPVPLITAIEATIADIDRPPTT